MLYLFKSVINAEVAKTTKLGNVVVDKSSGKSCEFGGGDPSVIFFR